jgi:hypothetical protein
MRSRAVIYEMAAGKKAFEGKLSASMMAKILEAEPPSMASLQPLLDRTFETEGAIYGFASYIYFDVHLRKIPDRLDTRFRAISFQKYPR